MMQSAATPPAHVPFPAEMLERFGQTRDTFGGPNTMRRENRWAQDRDMIANGHQSGVPTLALEDSLVCASAGPLRDRSNEHLAGADLAIAQMYRVLIKMARQGRDGQDPIGLGVSMADIRGTNASVDPSVEWRSLVRQHALV